MNKLAISAFVIIVIELLIGLLGFIDNDSYRTTTVAIRPFLWPLSLLAFILGVIALRQIARTNENGKTLAWLAIVIAGFKVLSTAGFLLTSFG
ncbi:MAG TPA: DUF4190 domain-containing protein [Candidatus Paceibacterota bacterium]